MIGVLLMAVVLSITRIASFNTYPFAIPSDWQKQVSSHLSKVSTTATITPSQKTINSLYKAEVIGCRGPWWNFDTVESATLKWIDWFNH